MKTSVVNTAVVALALSTPALARHKKSSGGGSSSQAGNTISTNYRFDKDTFGAGATLNLGVQAQNNGGNSQVKGKREIAEAMELYIRDLEDEMELVARFMNGGSARGGDSNSRSGNRINNSNNMSKARMGDNNVINMNTQTQVKGGNSQSGPGGINFGNGGKAGGFSFGKRGLDNNVISFSSQISANGRNSYAHSGHSNHQDGAPGMTMHFGRGFMDGGGAHGGDSNSRSGNTVNNKNDFRKMRMGNGNIIAANTQSQVRGGNSRSGRGGANQGSGGAGGQLSLQMPPLPPIKRDVDFDFEELFAREAFLSGGGARGGDSNSRSGNTVNNKNDFRKMRMGNGNTIAANTQTQVRGGNSRSGTGGGNSGSGGAGGSLQLQMPPLPPIKRDVDMDYEELLTREVIDDLYDELFVREAEAEPELEFEEEEFVL